MAARLTFTLEGDELERAWVLAQAQGLSVEDWLRGIIRQAENAPPIRPHDVLFGLFSDETALDDAAAERPRAPLRKL